MIWFTSLMWGLLFNWRIGIIWFFLSFHWPCIKCKTSDTHHFSVLPARCCADLSFWSGFVMFCPAPCANWRTRLRFSNFEGPPFTGARHATLHVQDQKNKKENLQAAGWHTANTSDSSQGEGTAPSAAGGSQTSNIFELLAEANSNSSSTMNSNEVLSTWALGHGRWAYVDSNIGMCHGFTMDLPSKTVVFAWFTTANGNFKEFTIRHDLQRKMCSSFFLASNLITPTFSDI